MDKRNEQFDKAGKAMKVGDAVRFSDKYEGPREAGAVGVIVKVVTHGPHVTNYVVSGLGLTAEINGKYLEVVHKYETGDYVKVEFTDETTGVGEWMWVQVHHCDDARKIVYGALDNIPLNDYDRRLRPGTELAISFDQIREHRKSSEFGSPRN
jgi:uncharacterized protein YxjI